ncbi:MAG: outer membrane protein assembly factor BamB family protein [Verrucomicrobiales bacterium]
MRFAISCLVVSIILLPTLSADDWPAYRHDAERSGFTTDALPDDLEIQWVHTRPAPPRPAWPRSDRMMFDRAPQPIVAGGLIFFGDSVDGSIHALDATTGEKQWTFPTRGPVRFAPAYLDGRLFATSDDGFLYCLKATDGSLIWKKRGGPGDELILGNDRMISRWPARGGAVIRDGIVYFAAGIWPSDGVSLYALEPATGKFLWVNDTAGSIYMGQPHGGAFAKSGVAAQGYLVASDDQIFMATGRAVPASFDRKTGAFQYLSLQENTHRGGSEVMLSDAFFVNNGNAFVQTTGALLSRVVAPPNVEMNGVLGGFKGKAFIGQRWVNKDDIDRKGKTQNIRGLEAAFTIPFEKNAISAIGAGDKIVIGGENEVSVFQTDGKSEAWTATVEGNVYGLAAANGQLFVSTDKGTVYCFGAGKPSPNSAKQKTVAPQFQPDSNSAKAVDEIIKKGKLTTGFALDIGCGDGQLAIALAKATDFFVYGIDTDPANISKARKNAIRAGIYGTRVMFLEADLEATKLPDFFANLVVSSASMTEGMSAGAQTEAQRVLRPWGGTFISGPIGNMKVDERGELKGAGQWTHQYADPANSVNSDDELIQGPLGMLWFSDLEQSMTQRHGRAPAPLFNNGILYSEGLNTMIAVDAYNGHLMWEYELPGILASFDGDHLMGTSGTGSNYCVSDDAVFVRRDDKCLRIDAQTGKLLAEFTAPKATGEGKTVWGYLAHDNGLLFGSLSDPEHVSTFRYRAGGDMNDQLTESKTFFALNATTGELVWKYDAEHSIRHNTIAIANRAVVLIDRAQAVFDRTKDAKATEAEHPTGSLIAFDAATGKELWRNQDDIYGTVAAISKEHHAVMMSYQPTRFRLASEVGGKLSVFDLSDGKLKWDTEADYSSRPLLNQDTIYAQGGAWDVLTGAEQPFNFKRSYGCGILAGSRHMMVFRSATLGYFDLTRNEASEDYGGIRPGCWINAIPAGGLVFVPDASAGCKCSYLNQSWIALRPGGIRSPKFSATSFFDKSEVTVEIEPDSPATKTIRYTLDGSSPTIDSPRYETALKIRDTHLLRARAFGENGQPSQVAEQQIRIDPFLISLDPKQWRTADSAGSKPASNWAFNGGVIEQTSNVFVGGKPTTRDTPDVERPGSLFLFDGAEKFGDGEITFEIRSTDNDALGFVLRHQGPEKFYLWSMSAERPYRALALKNGDDYNVLGGVKEGYALREWHTVRLVLEGSTITGYYNGDKDFTVDDATLKSGALGFYTWGNSGSYYRNLRFVPAGKE